MEWGRDLLTTQVNIKVKSKSNCSWNHTTERRQTQKEDVHAGEGGVIPNFTEKCEYLFPTHEYFMVLLGVSPHILLKCWNVFVNLEGEAEVRGDSARVSSSQKTLTEAWLLVWPLSLCTVGRGAVQGVRGRIRAEMTRNHPEPCSYAPKAPKIHMTDAFQETTPNMMKFAIKWSDREMRSPLLQSKQWTALQVKGADSVFLHWKNWI